MTDERILRWVNKLLLKTPDGNENQTTHQTHNHIELVTRKIMLLRCSVLLLNQMKSFSLLQLVGKTKTGKNTLCSVNIGTCSCDMRLIFYKLGSDICITIVSDLTALQCKVCCWGTIPLITYNRFSTRREKVCLVQTPIIVN